ncbi:hypothetical protein CCUS01_14307 [Colletotrichum cuscutae]|uniref:Uncharacterized protein n=1 Tax=Colletotrichum cuscutae TaxID=1209917 RepID=A0AAJ0DLH8_9PEZI|nr:hypothetical protein CCUS01_14307 [Colletotrichum cuscutae]
MTKGGACKPKTCVSDHRLRVLRATSTPGRLGKGKKFCGNFTKTVIANVSAVPSYARGTCATKIISRVGSAYPCLPTTTETEFR